MTTVCPTEAPTTGVSKPEVEPTVAIAVLPLLQATEDVISLVVLSEYLPVATNCSLAFRAVDGFNGVTVIELNVAAAGVVVTGGVVVAGGVVDGVVEPPPPPPPHAEINNAESAIAIERRVMYIIDYPPKETIYERPTLYHPDGT
jgi:hypothetical protein